MRRVGKGFSGVQTPLFKGMLVVGENVEEGITTEQVQDDADVAAAQEGVTTAIEEDVQEQSIPSPTPPPQPSQDLPSTSSVLPTPPSSPQPQPHAKPQAADFLLGCSHRVTAAIEEDVQEQFIPSPTPPPQPSQDLPSTSSVLPTPPSSPQPQPHAKPQAADFLLGLLQTALDTCAAFTSRIEQLESAKMSQALQFSKLKKRVKRLEKGNKVKFLKLRRLKKVGTSQRIDTLDDTIMKDVSNQGRMINELDRDEDVALTAEKEEERKTEEAQNSAGDDQVKGRQAEIY
nr:hypothetical protein [Tanacetum cinerariifolium]